MPRFLAKNGALKAPDLILKRMFFSEQSVTKRGILLSLCFWVEIDYKSTPTPSMKLVPSVAGALR